MLVGGRVQCSGVGYVAVLVRLLANAGVDPSFGGVPTGYVFTAGAVVVGLEALPDGRTLVVANGAPGVMYVTRLLGDGAIDSFYPIEYDTPLRNGRATTVAIASGG